MTGPEQPEMKNGLVPHGNVNKAFEKDDIHLSGATVVEVSDGDLKASKEDEEHDPWNINTVQIHVTPWNELSCGGKLKRVFWDYSGKVVFLIGFLYLFICSLDFLSSAFKLLGGRAAGEVFKQNHLLSNPVAGLMIGVLGTVLLQSSSTTTTIVVSMVASKIMDVKTAIPVVMGANIGTSVTNTIVSLGQITDKDDFRRAFAGATVHDMFNWLAVIILMPLESATGYLFHLTEAIKNSLHLKRYEDGEAELLKKLTKPFTNYIIQVDKHVIQEIAHGNLEAKDKSMIKHCCKKEDVTVELFNVSTVGNVTNNVTYNDTQENCVEKCYFLFEDISNTWSDTTVGIFLLLIALFILCTCLVCVVKILNSLLQGKIAVVIKKFVNSDLPGKLAYFTGYLAIVIGCGFTILVQSSSVFTSALTPLVGVGVVKIDRMYPLTLGANIGTTTTAIMASLAQEAEDIPIALQVALCHLFFNISGIILFFPIPQLRFPIKLAKFLGNKTAKYRWFAVVYLILLFFLVPAAIFGISTVSWIALAAVLSPLAFIVIVITVIKVLQSKVSFFLPKGLRNWKFLPLFVRSLEPYDRVISKLTGLCCCCKTTALKTQTESPPDYSEVQGNTRI